MGAEKPFQLEHKDVPPITDYIRIIEIIVGSGLKMIHTLFEATSVSLAPVQDSTLLVPP
jgi:hypothetical protein